MQGRFPGLCSALAAFVLYSVPSVAATSGEPSSVTDAEVRAFQLGLDHGCRNRGREKGDPADKVDAICGCVTAVLERNVSPEDWRRAVILERTRGSDAAGEVMRPYLPKVKACVAEKQGAAT
jgi:hypothetical protein